jgi:ergothioneine biosynthesis protein EgtB
MASPCPSRATAAAGGEHTAAAAGLVAAFSRVRGATARIVAPLSPEDCVVQSMPEASPAKWHLAHTSWFFEQFLLEPHLPGYRVFDGGHAYLFNSYYEAVGPRHARPERGMLTRPALHDVLRYRDHVDEHVARLLESSHRNVELRRIVALGLHHEQQHQELMLTDLKHLFSRSPLEPRYRADLAEDADAGRLTRPFDWVDFAGGLHEIGAAPQVDFCFDNERPRHRVWIEPYRLASRLVTNGEYLEFVREGGYRDARHWLSDGWDVVQRERWTHPLYWSTDLDSEFTLGGRRALQPDAPVCHISLYEADAFARWAAARLPTEAEWELAATSQPPHGMYAEADVLHPVRASGDESLAQMYGDTWEWTQSAHAPYPGYRCAAGALGEYNGKFMCNQFVLRGGSCATPAGHVRSTYRNFFHPGARWQFTGLRLARDGNR